MVIIPQRNSQPAVFLSAFPLLVGFVFTKLMEFAIDKGWFDFLTFVAKNGLYISIGLSFLWLLVAMKIGRACGPNRMGTFIASNILWAIGFVIMLVMVNSSSPPDLPDFIGAGIGYYLFPFTPLVEKLIDILKISVTFKSIWNYYFMLPFILFCIGFFSTAGGAPRQRGYHQPYTNYPPRY